MLKNFIFLCLLLSTSQYCLAKQFMTPYQAPLSADGKAFLLATAHPAQAELVLLHNVSRDPILLNRVLVNNPGVSAGWLSQLDPRRWSALSWEGDFTLSCQRFIDKSMQTVPCSQVLKLYKPVAEKKMARSSYWVVENKTRSVMINALLKAMVF